MVVGIVIIIVVMMDRVMLEDILFVVNVVQDVCPVVCGQSQYIITIPINIIVIISIAVVIISIIVVI